MPAGSSYPEFIQSMHLPAQLAEVDPIVASFCGGAVGVVSALLVVEVRANTQQGQKNPCAQYHTNLQLLISVLETCPS